MHPLRDCPDSVLSRIRGVLADIDDTLTTDGRLRAEAYAAMESIQSAGLMMIPITGRPAGWCDHIARMWPVDAVVGENGAFWFRYDGSNRSMTRYFVHDAEQRRAQRKRLREIASEVLQKVPRASVASDQLYREADLAIDFCEDVPRLTSAEIDSIVALMRDRGLTVKVSSIHVNGWFGTHDKFTTTRNLLASMGADNAHLHRDFCYIGDSPNDEPMFGFFDCSIGVANVRDFIGGMRQLPRYVTEARGGAGFAELAVRLLHSFEFPGPDGVRVRT
jgi:HAD superfamily hydrolase (TIGR01484 family)